MNGLIRRRRPLLLLVLLCLWLPDGCRSHGGDPHNQAQVRLINAISDSDELSVAVDGQQVWRHSFYRNNTGFRGVDEGDYPVRVDAIGRLRPLLELAPIPFQKNRAYTVIAVGLVHAGHEPAGLRIFEDPAGDPVPAGKARLRFINAAPGSGAMDVLFNNIVALKEVAYGSRSATLLLGDGPYDIKVTPSGTDTTPLIGPVSLRFEAGQAYTLVAMGDRTFHSLSLEAYPDR